MVQRQRQDAAIGALKMIPTKWAIIIVVALISYVLLQPRLNQWFGWHLPSFAAMVGDEKPAPKKDQDKVSNSSKTKKETSRDSATDADDAESLVGKKTKTTPKREPANSKGSGTKPNQNDVDDTDEVSADTKAPKAPPKLTPPVKDPGAHSNDEDPSKMHGVLSEVGRNRYESPEGLLYGPGSEEGHRLKHIARHLEDQPDRPGSHGVFRGDMKEFLEAIDDGYARAKRGAKGTKKTAEDDSTVYEASFDKAIGFQGGREGGRKGNPALKRLRIVVRGNSVITAFPF